MFNVELHNKLKSEARTWEALTQEEREHIMRTVRVSLWNECPITSSHPNTATTLWGKNGKGEWCRYS